MNQEPIKVLHMTKLGAGGISSLTISINKCIDLTKVVFDYLVFEDVETFYEKEVYALQGKKQIVDVSKCKNKLYLYWRKYCGVKRLLKRESYDVVHVDASTPMDVVIGMAAKAAGVKTIIIHSHIAGDNKHTRARDIYLQVCRNAMVGVFSHYFAISKESADFMFPKRIIKNNNYIIYKNGIMAERYCYNAKTRNETRKQLEIDNKFVLGHVGRFSKEKNHLFLIDVFSKVAMEKKDAVLLLVGMGQEKEVVEAYVRKLGLTKKVIFYGVSRDVPRLLLAMDAFIFPSKYEGLGIVAIEAQCSGLRTYCSPGIPEEANITDLFIKFDNYNADTWAKQILQDIEDCLGIRTDRIDEIKEAQFDIWDVAKRLERFYIEQTLK